MVERLLVFAQCLLILAQRGVWGVKLVHKPLRFSHNIRNGVGCANFSHTLWKFRRVCELFACSVKISQNVRNEFAWLIYFRRVCKIFAPHAKWAMNFTCSAKISQNVQIAMVFPLPRIFKDMPNCFEVPPAINHQKLKLNQIKLKLKREINIKTSNNTGKLLNQK